MEGEDDKKYKERTLSTIKMIEAVILIEFKELVYTPCFPYIKFLLFGGIIEFLGACLDSKDFQDNKLSEDRFNLALKKLFPKKYRTYAKKDAKAYLYTGFRCNMIHKLTPNGFVFTTRAEAIREKNKHLELDVYGKGKTVLILEDFYDDTEKAANNLIKMYKEGKAPKYKGEISQLIITSKK